MKKKIIVTTTIEGVHCYPDAPKEVEYLKYPHRHNFKIKVEWEVKHSNRDKEFIIMKHKLNEYFKEAYWDKRLKLHQFNDMSCEKIAEFTLSAMQADGVEVWEDEENGARIEK